MKIWYFDYILVGSISKFRPSSSPPSLDHKGRTYRFRKYELRGSRLRTSTDQYHDIEKPNARLGSQTLIEEASPSRTHTARWCYDGYRNPSRIHTARWCYDGYRSPSRTHTVRCQVLSHSAICDPCPPVSLSHLHNRARTVSLRQ